MSKQEEFIAAIGPHAQEVQRKYGVPASIVIAQAALESGWGRSVKGNNFFGIKAGKAWQGATLDMGTHEYFDGKRVQISDRFRAYGSMQESIENYGQFLAKNPRYSKVIAADSAHEAADALQRAGYATDPRYAAKLKDIISANNLTRFDDASYRGYTEGARFEQTRQRLQDQRESNPSVWDDFMKNFIQLIVTICESLSALIFGGEQRVSAPLATPASTQVAVSSTPSRG